MEDIIFKPIGYAQTPWNEREETPKSPTDSNGTRGVIKLLPEFEECLHDVDGFSHVMVIFNFHKSEGYSCKVTPPHQTSERGVFATHAPFRPNAIGVSVLRLISVEGCNLTVENVDMFDGTPILDIKPYFPPDEDEEFRCGWWDER